MARVKTYTFKECHLHKVGLLITDGKVKNTLTFRTAFDKDLEKVIGGMSKRQKETTLKFVVGACDMHLKPTGLTQEVTLKLDHLKNFHLKEPKESPIHCEFTGIFHGDPTAVVKYFKLAGQAEGAATATVTPLADKQDSVDDAKGDKQQPLLKPARKKASKRATPAK